MICHATVFLRVGRPGEDPPLLRGGGSPPGNPVTKGVCGGGTLRTSPAGMDERRLEEGHSGAVPLHGSAVPTDKWCVHPHLPSAFQNLRRIV
jgi:hypothetical protein